MTKTTCASFHCNRDVYLRHHAKAGRAFELVHLLKFRLEVRDFKLKLVDCCLHPVTLFPF